MIILLQTPMRYEMGVEKSLSSFTWNFVLLQIKLSGCITKIKTGDYRITKQSWFEQRNIIYRPE